MFVGPPRVLGACAVFMRDGTEYYVCVPKIGPHNTRLRDIFADGSALYGSADPAKQWTFDPETKNFRR